MATIIKDYGFVVTSQRQISWGASGSARYGRISTVAEAGAAVLAAERGRVKSVRVDTAPASQASPAALPLNGSDRSGAGRAYRMNVPKFRRKAIAYSLLRRSLRFLAFYSVSFPAGMPDDVAFVIWNKLLTRLRQSLRLRSYMWVMERQKNGTVHYHMLTNDFMNITEVNRYAAVAIENEVARGKCTWGASSFERYNGVDVKAVITSKTGMRAPNRNKIVKSVVGYLSKYMSKELACETHRVWHCSRLVSALCTAASVDEADMREIVDAAEAAGRKVKVLVSEFASVIICPVIDSVAFRDTIVRINDAIYNFFERHNLF